ncbi:YifB family Mg chelatase-like AAA ATPase [Nocardioides marmorisolisilvae]|uniref:ATP-binding protein n=1 Tax=Nocardioides marmorisolisilvae TaxID=1542737 RepID=A0A3N0DWH6_9ACTN|nr:YifB family Mg chelatase-like AAA ATPase [Nocardioides marmorisolisilvae]RNL79836.1 ATP-binding protein [Nocardioides marmorisolisilvae]
MLATARTVSLQGARGHVVDVQVDLSAGQVATVLVGRPDASISEGRERCRAAIVNSGHDWPAARRVTILLSPTDLPKRGPHFDLAMAVAVMVANKMRVPEGVLARTVLIGELSLDGRLRSTPGVLPMVMAAAAHGITRVVVPEPQSDEAALVEGVEVFGVRSLNQVVAVLRGEEIPEAPEVEPLTGEAVLTWRGEDRIESLDLADVIGMLDCRYALEVAAAGSHHLLLNGAKGAGKTSLAERLPTILPRLDQQQSLELTAIHSLCGALPGGASVLSRAPFRAPHHTASRSGILGGGTGRVQPGEVSKAHHGVLFLDEFPLLPSDVVEALRQPLESGLITIARGDDEATYPAGGMLVLACNPCPCGEFSPRSPDNACICSVPQRRNYQKKISGPIADRIDITRYVEQERQVQAPCDPSPESSAAVALRVAGARDRQRTRYAGTDWSVNGHVPGHALRNGWPLEPRAAQQLDSAVYAGSLTRRGATRVHRVAWTVADLRGVDRPGLEELFVALRLRRGEPLDLAVVQQLRAAQ